ncbi:restriction endonuclease subunit S [Campylobacter jejuni]|uniref:restriction endonuclease subunit S n=1 Tax=Campylobacter jejuni TaxID=197 RepID=UPI000F7FB479|nr:restriction endonuclease subunit S [Campylobacter jejuni]RTH72626.1 restriction endonuclease subunit S [Campylobacter jejuni]UDZ84914.1 restriction endonuclease subunit S [Campylobacter jejuni]UDZ86534.1 restriction endonuclease subunit S [Campylobacter jejuni]
MKNFKDSGIEWLGEIPEHWKLIKCKNFFVLKSIPIGDLWNKTKLLSLTLNGVIERDINNPEGKFPSDFSTYQIVKEGDLIFCLFDVAETPRTIGLSKLNGMITSAYTIFEIKNQEKRFLEYFFIDLDNRKNLKFLYRGLRNTISKEDLLNLKIPLPPLKEQEQIANFLDEKCEQIKNFIEKKEKLITLLKEQKQAFINKATTKGLDKNVNFKDSGIEWLGEIPEHWKLIKCKNFFVLKSIPIGDLWNKTKLLSLTLNGVIERDINNPEGKFPSDFSTYQIVKEGDLIFCLFDVAETPRTIGLSKLNGMITSAYTIFEIKNQEKRFLEYFFIDLDNRKNLKFLYRGLRNTISKEDLLNLKIPLPPLKEQEQIANFLDEKCKKIDLLIEKTEKQIKLIKEYKTTLINQAVCGRINN